MRQLWNKYGWIPATIFGSTVFAVGFALFLQPNDMNPGGVSGLAMAVVEIFGVGSVGVLSILINLPLFLLGGLKIGKKFFVGSLMGMVLSSVLIDLLAKIPAPPTEPLLSAIYGTLICGLGLGVVFVCGTSTGGSDILVRLMKLKYRNVPIGQISLVIDGMVVILTGIVFHDISKALYTGIVVFICSKVVDAVVYRFDYSKVALIISKDYEKITQAIDQKLGRGATYLNGEGSYSRQPTKVVLAAVKKQQVAELKELVIHIDPNAFIIVQEAHQVLGDGFARYSKESL